MTDKLREAIEALPRYDMEQSGESSWMGRSLDGDYLRRDEVLAALAAAPQPMGCGLPCGYDCNGACFDAAAPQPAPEWEICEVCRGTGFAGHPDSGNTCYLCNGSGAVDPPPAITDRQALVRLLQIITRNGSLDDGRTLHEVIADALLARGLRLPGDETMAWAVLGEDGKMVAINYDRMTAQHLCNPGERIVRVAIRVVEGGGDAA